MERGGRAGGTGVGCLDRCYPPALRDRQWERDVPEVLEGEVPQLFERGDDVSHAFAPTKVDERAARQSLRSQIARLESELGALFCASSPGQYAVAPRIPASGPRVLSLSELERVRDSLLDSLAERRRVLSDRAFVEERNRRRIEEMLRDPGAHRWEIVTNEDIGEPGCKNWHVRPRWGAIGMLMSWWRVKISSGCPLAGGHGPRAVTPLPSI